MNSGSQSAIQEFSRRLCWVLAVAAILLTCGVRYYDGKSRAMRVNLDRMAREQLYLEGLTRDFERVLEDVATSSASNGTLRLLLAESGLKLNLTSSGGPPAPAPGGQP